MTTHPCPEIWNLDDDLRGALIRGVLDQSKTIEDQTSLLEKEPHRHDYIHNIFRSLHIIKGNLKMCQLNRMVEYLDHLEDMFEGLRSGSYDFSSTLSEAFLLSLDVLKACLQSAMENYIIGKAEISEIETVLHKLAQSNSQSADKAAGKIVDTITRLFINEPTAAKPATNTVAQDVKRAYPAPFYQPNAEEDLGFFSSLSEKVDSISVHWEGRNQCILELCKDINAQLHHVVPEEQLHAAVLMHDFGMLLIPAGILEKRGTLALQEIAELKKHPVISAEFMRRFNHWDIATDMVLQHHERFDGMGYPYKLKGSEIHPGAVIIAIADTFYSITNSRADRIHKKSVLRAVAEINSCANKQFAIEIVHAFNDVFKNKWCKAS